MDYVTECRLKQIAERTGQAAEETIDHIATQSHLEQAMQQQYKLYIVVCFHYKRTEMRTRQVDVLEGRAVGGSLYECVEKRDFLLRVAAGLQGVVAQIQVLQLCLFIRYNDANYTCLCPCTVETIRVT